MAGNVGAAFAAAADLADDKTRARNMGLLGAAVGFGFIAGPALGAFLDRRRTDRASFARVCYVSAGACRRSRRSRRSCSSAKACRRQRASQPATRVRAALALLASRPALARFVAVMFLVIAAQALMETTFGLWADAELHWGPREVGWTLAALGVGAVLLQGGGAGSGRARARRTHDVADRACAVRRRFRRPRRVARSRRPWPRRSPHS